MPLDPQSLYPFRRCASRCAGHIVRLRSTAGFLVSATTCSSTELHPFFVKNRPCAPTAIADQGDVTRPDSPFDLCSPHLAARCPWQGCRLYERELAFPAAAHKASVSTERDLSSIYHRCAGWVNPASRPLGHLRHVFVLPPDHGASTCAPGGRRWSAVVRAFFVSDRKDTELTHS